MTTSTTRTFDVYRNRAKPTLRVAIARGGALPRPFAARDWTLMKETSVLHSDTPKDIAIKGYCYFEVFKG